MVSYQAWTSICFDVAEEKGAQFPTIAESSQFVQDVVSVLWRREKETLTTATRSEARDVARRNIEA